MTKPTKTADKTRAAKSKAARKNKLAKTTTAKLVWRDVTAKVRHNPDYISKGWSHIELIVVAPKGAPLPITSTGYLSHFLDADELRRAGGPVAFFQAWLDREAKTKVWARTEFKWRQLELPFSA